MEGAALPSGPGPEPLAYEVVGAGPPLVLVHGLSGSRRWWRRNVPALAAHFRVYGVDLTGFGESRRGGRFALDRAAAALAEWMDRLAIERAAVVGHSMGGLVAADLAALFPARVERLVLVDAAIIPLGRRYHRHALGLLGALRYAAPSFLPVLALDALRAGPRTMLLAIRQLLRADITARLPQIAAPTLIIWGERDTLVPPAMGRQLHGLMPQARLVVIPGAGHNPMWDRPGPFNREVLEFLRA